MIIITGASKGIGNFLFTKYLAKGEKVVGTYLTTPPSLIDKKFLSKVDVSSYSMVEKWIKTIRNDLSRIVLINCAAISFKSFTHKSDPEEWRRVIEVNLIGTYNVIRCLLPIMREQEYGRIINFSSVVSQVPVPGVSAYAASKAGLWGFSKSLAIENGSKNITINNINLGYANIGMGINDVPTEYLQEIKTRIPNGKLCDAIDIFDTVQFLIDEAYINGASIDLNGGLI